MSPDRGHGPSLARLRHAPEAGTSAPVDRKVKRNWWRRALPACSAAALAAGSTLAASAASAPKPERSGRFADRAGGLVGLERAAIDLNGGTLPHPGDGDLFARFTAREFGVARRNGLIKITRPTRGIVVRDVVAEDGYRVLDVFTREAGLFDSTVERVRVTGAIRGFARIRADSRNVTFRDIDVTFRSELAQPGELPVGIGLEDSAEDVLIERTVVRGARMVRIPDKYTNGDGYSTERGNRRITFRQAEAYDASDGGFDLKSTETRLEDTVAGGNGRNYRLWRTGAGTTVISRDPTKAHIWLGKGAHWRIRRLVVRSRTRAPVIQVSPGATLLIDSHDVQVPAGTRIVAGDGGGRVDWGPQGPPRVQPIR